MEKLEKIRATVKEVFLELSNTYELNYSLKELADNKVCNHIDFIIYGNTGLVANFSVSDYCIFEAYLTSDITTCTYELEWWHDFVSNVKKALREVIK